MRSAPITIPGSAAPGETPAATLRAQIAPEHRTLSLVQRDADARTHPGQTPNYAEAMAESIEACARDILHDDLTFEGLWARASSTIASLYLARRDLPANARPNRAQGNLPLIARLINELDPSEFVTLRAEHDWTQHDWIAPRLQSLAAGLRTRGDFDAQRHTWTLGDYQLARAEPSGSAALIGDEATALELRIATPRLEGHPNAGPVVWHLDDNTLTPARAALNHARLADPASRHAVRNHVKQRLDALSAAQPLPLRLAQAYEAYWWMLRQNLVAVGDKAQHVMQSVLLATGHDLPPTPAGIDPALEALSRSLPDWLDRAPEIWGHGVRPYDLFQRELTGRFPAPRRSPLPESPVVPDELMLGCSPSARRRRAQIEAKLRNQLQANLRIA